MRRLAGLLIYVAVALYTIYSAFLMLVNSSSKAHEYSKIREQVLSEKIVVSSTPTAKQNSTEETASNAATAKETEGTDETEKSPQLAQETQGSEKAQNSSVANVQEQSHKDYILGKINEYRASQGVSAASLNTETCSFARTRAGEISSNFNHDSFTQKISSNTLPYPSYSLVTENIAMTSNYQDVADVWIKSAPHAENLRKDTPFICVEQNGDYYAYEGWKP